MSSVFEEIREPAARNVPVRRVSITVTGEKRTAHIEPRLLLAHLLRQGFKGYDNMTTEEIAEQYAKGNTSAAQQSALDGLEDDESAALNDMSPDPYAVDDKGEAANTISPDEDDAPALPEEEEPVV